jgi:hypothetical protein
MKAQLKIASIILIFALIYIYLYLRLKLPLSSSNSGKSFNLKSRIIESFKNYSFGNEHFLNYMLFLWSQAFGYTKKNLMDIILF